MERLELTAAPGDSGRLDAWLAGQCPTLSRSALQNLIEQGLVTCGGAPGNKKDKVAPGKVYAIDLPDPQPIEARPQNIPLDIVYEDDDLLVVNKPKGMVVHPASMDVLPGVVELRYCLNDGMAFSMLAGKQGLLIGMTSVMLLAVLIMLFVRKMPLTERAAWTLVLGGGVGNLIDRVLNGVVVDYINVLFMRFAIFNFADICVCVGVGLLMLAVLLDSFKKDKTAEPKADEDGAA